METCWPGLEGRLLRSRVVDDPPQVDHRWLKTSERIFGSCAVEAPLETNNAHAATAGITASAAIQIRLTPAKSKIIVSSVMARPSQVSQEAPNRSVTCRWPGEARIN